MLTVAQEPKLKPLWDSTKNTEPASKVPAHSYHPAWWTCTRGHSFQRSPRMMLRDPSCKECTGTGAATSIAKKRPHLVPMWHPTKNGTTTPSTTAANAPNAVWWQCAHGHEFQRAPLQMDSDSSCPACELLETTSLAVVNPVVAAEWHKTKNGDLTPKEVSADHMMNVWWQCPNGHEYQATVRSRVKADRRCPVCFGGWSITNIRAFVKSLLAHITAFNESERFALAMQAGVLKDARAREFMMELIKTDRFPPGELEKFVEGKPSAVDDFAREAFRLKNEDGGESPSVAPPRSDRFALPAGPAHTDDANVDIDISKAIDTTTRATQPPGPDGELPIVQTRDALAALDGVLVASADAETVQFLIASAKAKLWAHAYVEPEQARMQAESFSGDVYSSSVRDEFLSEFVSANELAKALPAGYAFRPQPERSHRSSSPHAVSRRRVCPRSPTLRKLVRHGRGQDAERDLGDARCRRSPHDHLLPELRRRDVGSERSETRSR